MHYDTVIAIRLTLFQRDSVRASADAAGMSVSRYGRHRLLGYGVRAYTDAATQRELRRIGGLVRHTDDAITASADPAARNALRAVSDAAERLGSPPPRRGWSDDMAGVHYDAVVPVRLTGCERESVRASADAAGISVSRYGRDRIVGHAIHAYTDAATIRKLRGIGRRIRDAYDAITTDPDPAAQEAARHDARTALQALTAAAEKLAQEPQ